MSVTRPDYIRFDRYISCLAVNVISSTGRRILVVSCVTGADKSSLGESIPRFCTPVALPPLVALSDLFLGCLTFSRREQRQQSTQKYGAHPNSYGVIS